MKKVKSGRTEQHLRICVFVFLYLYLMLTCIILLDEESEKWGDGGTVEQRWNGQRAAVSRWMRRVSTPSIFSTILYFYIFVFIHFYISICMHFSIFLKILTHMTTIVILLNVFVVGGPG